MKDIYWFSEINKNNIPEVGGKGANLGEMTKVGLPVPPGFIISSSAYQKFIKKTGLNNTIKKSLAKINPEDSKTLQQTATFLQKQFIAQKLPDFLEKEITIAYQDLSSQSLKKEPAVVAVRSSATAEDLPEASFAGQQATFLNICGQNQLLQAVLRAYASLFTARAIYYRIINKFDHLKVSLAVPVQKMIESEVAGIMFTADPITSDETKIVIEAGWGLGEAIVSGSVTPDTYLIDKKTMAIISKQVVKQTWQIVRQKSPNLSQDLDLANIHASLPKDQQELIKLNDEQIIALAKIGQKIENHYKHPQDSEWAIENSSIYMIQTRPITTLNKKIPTANITKQEETTEQEVILQGTGASIGTARGIVKILAGPSEIDRIQKGDVLVAEMTTPDYVPAMRRAAAIITDTGGKTSHAAIVSRELGIPCVVGTGSGSQLLKEGMLVTVDGAEGRVYKGKIDQLGKKSVLNGRDAISRVSTDVTEYLTPITATKVYVNLGEPERAKEVADLPVDGVGLARAEFIISEIGEHPKSMIEKGKGKEWSKKLAEKITIIAQAFSPRPVVYRASDFKTNEYRSLKGGSRYEQEEANPMIGFRGEFRYITNPDVFQLELEAIKYVRERLNFANLWLMIPFVRTIDELRQAKKIVEKSGLNRSNDFKIWIMAEVPSVAILMKEFCQEGIDGVSIGSNDLTQLILGIDRDNEKLASLFDERNEAVERTMAHIITTCRQNHISCSICGQAPSNYPEIVELFVKTGATSISVSPDKVVETKRLIASIEKKLLLQSVMKDETGCYLGAL